MSNHVRRQIREYAYGLVINGTTLAGSSVFDSKTGPFQTADLPAVAVYTPLDATDLDRGPDIAGNVERVLELSFAVRAKATANVEDQIDQLDEEIQALILADTTFGGLAHDATHAQTTIEYVDEQEKPLAAAEITYRVTYGIVQTDATVAV